MSGALNLKFSDDMHRSFEHILKYATNEGHTVLLDAHAHLMILESGEGAALLQHIKLPLDAIRSSLEIYIGDHVPANRTLSIRRSRSFDNLFQYARELATQDVSGDKDTGKAQSPQIDALHVLAAAMRDSDSPLSHCLASYRCSREDINRAISRFRRNKLYRSQRAKQGDPLLRGDAEAQEEANLLEQFTLDLTALAGENKLDRLIGHQVELERLESILARRYKCHAIITGDPGVGKTALVHGLAQAMQAGTCGDHLKDQRLLELPLTALMSGTRYRGDLEERITAIIKEIEDDEKTILVIDDIHIASTGSNSGSMNISAMLRPSLEKRKLRVIGISSVTDYQRMLDQDPAFARRFQRLELAEMNDKEVHAVLENITPVLEKHHSVRYAAEVIPAVTALSRRHLRDRKLPDQAIDLLDEAGAKARVGKPKRKTVGLAHIEKLVAKIARIPEPQLDKKARGDISQLGARLRKKVFAQDSAIDNVAEVIMLSRAGLRPDEKPLGCFLFVGPTGVGKTLLAQELAKEMSMPLVRFDMSEYAERHTASRLLGAPPGYVGHENAGHLTDAVRRTPNCVLLFDEIEKAHPDIHNIFLQLMDYGTVSDSQGHTTDFSNTLVIMTTNQGASEAQRTSVGFEAQDSSSDMVVAVERGFSPEFRNRLDAVINFGSLATDAIHAIVSKLFAELAARVKHKHSVALTLTPGARQWLGANGYDPKMGARPLARLIEREVSVPVAKVLLKAADAGKLPKQLKVYRNADRSGLDIR